MSAYWIGKFIGLFLNALVFQALWAFIARKFKLTEVEAAKYAAQFNYIFSILVFPLGESSSINPLSLDMYIDTAILCLIPNIAVYFLYFKKRAKRNLV